MYLDNIVTSLKYSKNNPSPTSTVYKTFEDIRDTITDGKGVGGAVDSKGVQLSRGVVSGEDQVSERRRGGVGKRIYSRDEVHEMATDIMATSTT